MDPFDEVVGLRRAVER